MYGKLPILLVLGGVQYGIGSIRADGILRSTWLIRS